jgi:hypothetical protein
VKPVPEISHVINTACRKIAFSENLPSGDRSFSRVICSYFALVSKDTNWQTLFANCGASLTTPSDRITKSAR